MKELNIKLILNTAKECKNYYKTEFIYKKFSFIDEEFENIFDFFEESFDFIGQSNLLINFKEMGRRNNSSILIHCFMGMSRSAAVCIAVSFNLFLS
jgi:protein-tyrosine phosphatase